MKKHISLILSIGIIGLILSFSVTGTYAEYGVEVGDTFTYSINKASGDFNYKTNTSTTSKTVEGYQLGDDVIPVGSELLVNITEVAPLYVNMNISSGTTSIIANANVLYTAFGLIMMMLLPMLVFAGEASVDADEGITLGEWLFIMPSDLNWDDFIENWNTTEEDPFNETSSGDLTLSTGSILENSDRDIRFWITMVGTYINTTEQIDLTANHKAMFAYDTATGVLLGYRVSTDVSGTFEGTTSKFKMNLEIIREGYSLPAFPGSPIPGFESIIVLLSLILVVPIIRRKKK